MDVMTAIQTRRSVRAYKPDPIQPDLLERVTDAMRVAPSACNYQPWHFVLVTQSELIKKLAQASHAQMFIAEAPVLVVACAEAAQAYPRMGGYWNSADIDVAIAMVHLTLAATEAGLGTCWIGAFDEGAVKDLLGIPNEAKVVAMTPLGWPREASLLHPLEQGQRKNRDEVFSFDRY
jgi:nitroreductase